MQPARRFTPRCRRARRACLSCPCEAFWVRTCCRKERTGKCCKTRLPRAQTRFFTCRPSRRTSLCSTRAGPMKPATSGSGAAGRSEEHTSELQSHVNLVCRLLLEQKNNVRAQKDLVDQLFKSS